MRTLKINLLYRCTAKCAHCRFNCENESTVSKPDFHTPVKVAKQLKDNFGLDMAVVLGGEPSIFADETSEMLSNLSKLGIQTRIETNASWADTFDHAVRFLAPLKDLNTNVMLSLDGFHEPYVPVEKIVHAINACIRLQMDFNLEIPYLDINTKKHPIDMRTAQLAHEIDTLFGTDGIRKYEGGILFIGRAARTYGDEFAEGRGIPSGACTAVPWWMNGDIATTELVILEPGGYITKGCGIAIGNIFERDIVHMLRNYNAGNHPIFSVLLKDGPLGLAKMAVKYGYEIKKDYADKCHLCHEARQALKPYFKDVLQPDQHYI